MVMRGKTDREKLILEEMVNTITRRPSYKVEDLLASLKGAIKDVEDVRFRPVDWKGKAVVYVPGWSTQEGTEATEDVDPKLFRRVFFDPEEPSRMDCLVGLVARVARIQQEERTNPKSALLKDLKKGVSKKEIHKPKHLVNNIKDEQAFKSFIERFEGHTEDLKEFKDKWEKFYNRIQKFPKNEGFFDEVENANPPWGDNTIKKSQWKQLRDTLPWKKKFFSQEDRKQTSKHPKQEQFLLLVRKTVRYYSTLHKQWDKYTSNAKIPRCEIAVPVIAAGRLLGILNFHREKGFSETEVEVSLYHAALLAVFLLRNQAELLGNLQKVASAMTTETTLEKIASEIAKGIRETLVGLKPDEVYPLLYVCKQPISAKENLQDLQDFADRWRDSYQRRQEPQDKKDHKLWKREQELGPIPIRIDGRGNKSIMKWKDQAKDKVESIKANSYFVVSGDVDNPDSDTGSRTALKHSIKTTGCLPLIFNHRVYGLLYLHCTKHHFFTEAELEALETFAIQAAIAINNAKLVGPSYEMLYGNALLDSLTKGR